MVDLLSIPCMQSYTVINKITEGYSGDEKYKLIKDGSYFLLRVGEKKETCNSKKEFDRLKMYLHHDINTHKPICFGTTENNFYSIVSWVDGTTVMNIIKNDVCSDYYKLGIAVGNELKKIHTSSKSNSKVEWQDIVQKKADLFLHRYENMNIKFPKSELANKYIHNNLNTIPKHAHVILHGDFHWNNVVVDGKGDVGIIDFSGNDIGDPWYDFGGLLWALEYSESFANGQIDGYFGTPPIEFWKAFKFYVALYAFEHLLYTNGNKDDIQCRINNASRMLNIFGEDFDLEIPIFRNKITNKEVMFGL